MKISASKLCVISINVIIMYARHCCIVLVGKNLASDLRAKTI